MGDEAERVVMARSMMWQAATGDEQAAWLRAADDLLASLKRAASQPAQIRGDEEGQAYPPLRALP